MTRLTGKTPKDIMETKAEATGAFSCTHVGQSDSLEDHKNQFRPDV